MKILKRLSLEFLGDKYKDSYIELECITLDDYPNFQKQLLESQKNDASALDFIKNSVQAKISDGDVNGEKVTSENAGQLPVEVYFRALEAITGEISPKS